MSVATQFAPTVHLPPQTRLRDERLATVITLHRPSARSVAAPLRLTTRGMAVVAAAVAVLAFGLVWLAWLSAPSAPAAGPAAGVGAPAVVTVHDGDTLWSIATQVAPGHDPRAEVVRLQRLNHLPAVDLVAGQVLRVR